MVRITSGTGAGQRFRIVGNTTNTIEICRNWDIQPNNTSVFEIWPNTSEIYLMGNASSALFKYSVPYDYWYQAPDIDYGQTINISASYPGQEPFAISTGIRNANGITVLASAPTVGGLNYAVGDFFNITTGGTNAKGRVTAVGAGGVVTAVTLFAAGTNYTTGTGKVTSAILGAGNNALTVNITSVGTIGRITTATSHNLISGDTITISGCTDAAWNTSYPVLATDSLTAFDIIITAAASAVASSVQSSTLIVDASKSWVVNEHTGKIVTVTPTGGSSSSRRILGNTSSTLTVTSISTPINGTSKYTITQPDCFGSAQSNLIDNQKAYGNASSGSLTTLVDSSKNWKMGQWAGYKFRVVSGTGVGKEVLITSSSNNTLTYSTETFTPDATTQYRITDTFGPVQSVVNSGNAVVTVIGVNMDANRFAGKRLRITAGTGVGQELTIISNTSVTITLSGVFGTAPDATSLYVIYEIPARGLATSVLWLYGGSDITNRGRYLFSPRGGGSNLFDRYNITTNIWDLAINSAAHTETFTTGTMYAYDGDDTIVIHRGDLANTMRTLGFNINTLQVDTLGMPPYNHSTPVIGNRMEIVTTVDGLDYLYIMRHTGQEMWRTLLF
jgi:hypothetical protein